MGCRQASERAEVDVPANRSWRAFQLAFMIPNLFRRLLGEGALTAAFIPIFKEKEKTHGEVEMWRTANAVISGLVVAACVIISLAMLGVSVALGMHQFEGQTELMLQLLRVMFPYMLLVCLAAAFMGMLNARGHFFIPAMGATMLNVVMIASVLWFAPRMGLNFPKEERLPHQIFALAFGVLAAGVVGLALVDGIHRDRSLRPLHTLRRLPAAEEPATVEQELPRARSALDREGRQYPGRLMKPEHPREIDVTQDVRVVEEKWPAVVEEPRRVLQPPAGVEQLGLALQLHRDLRGRREDRDRNRT